MDYMGGTYISQHEAESKEVAMMLWIDNLEIEEIEGFTEDDKTNISHVGFENEDPCLLDGLINVWHFIVNTKEDTAYINMVLTCSIVGTSVPAGTSL